MAARPIVVAKVGRIEDLSITKPAQDHLRADHIWECRRRGVAPCSEWRWRRSTLAGNERAFSEGPQQIEYEGGIHEDSGDWNGIGGWNAWPTLGGARPFCALWCP